ncbi:MAG: hypothetical protein N3I35_10815 [Clostridia bacterium]|nr:hypothetical protein [Clostridia bacterium]
MERMDKIKNHFEEEAGQYDGIIKNLIPCDNLYVSEMLQKGEISGCIRLDL